MKFSSIAKGTRARKTVPLPLGEGAILSPVVGPDGAVTFPPAEGVVLVGLRVLNTEEMAEVYRQACARAKSKGVDDPKSGNPIYELAEIEHTLALCVVDADSPLERPEPFFASVDEIRVSPHLGQDRLLYLFEQWQAWQNEGNPRLHHLQPEELLAALDVLGTEEEAEAQRFFTSLGPALQWSCTRILASLRASAPTPSSTPTSASGAASPPATPRSDAP